MEGKTVNHSSAVMLLPMTPQDANLAGNVHGGVIMKRIDEVGAIVAVRHCQTNVVTASVDRIDFHHPIKLGDAVSLVASVNRVFSTSMEIGVKVYAESFKEGKRVHTNTAYLTFVSVDTGGRPVEAIEAVPETDDEKRRYDEALQRREARLKERFKQV